MLGGGHRVRGTPSSCDIPPRRAVSLSGGVWSRDGASEGLVDGTVDAELPPPSAGVVGLVPLDVQANQSLGVEDPG
jgi:hypothetical protein